MDYVIVRTHVVNHERFLEAGPHARDLWQWGMLYAGQHETDGELPMVAVLASPWGHGGKRNVVLADRLVEVGLWERTYRGYRVRRWAEQGNKTKVEIEGTRAVWRAKAASKRRRDSTPAAIPEESPSESLQGTPQRVLNSHSNSLKRDPDRESLGVLEGPSQSAGVGSGAGALDEPLSDAWRADAEGQIAPTGEPVDVDAEWALYVPDRIAKGKSLGAADWRVWIRRAIVFSKEKRMRDRERADAAARRRDPPGAIQHRKTKAEIAAEGERAAARFGELERERLAKKAHGL